ncbi:energy transducer TonB [Spirosoma gilvum]
MKIWFILLLFIGWSPKLYSQFTVYQNESGQVFTTFDTYSSGINASARTQTTYQGSPFLTYPVWQPGTVLLDKHGKQVDAELAYNLVTNEVLYRFPGDSTVKIITPETFTINSDRFIHPQGTVSATNFRPYLLVLSDGKTKLLKGITRHLRAYGRLDSYRKDIYTTGAYITKIDYYIQKGEAKPELINLAKSNTILAVLYEQADKLKAQLPAKTLTPEALIDVLGYYNRLMEGDRTTKSPLMANPTFIQVLHQKITYPAFAQNQGIYGRVYAGFDINNQGQITNVIILSPDNAGFRFDLVVKNALANMPPVNFELQGSYILPVAFILTNTKESSEPHIPVNQLADDRLAGKTVLEEFTVKTTISKPGISSREVWGYYK